MSGVSITNVDSTALNKQITAVGVISQNNGEPVEDVQFSVNGRPDSPPKEELRPVPPRESCSGFMLLSVKHLSKVKKGKIRDRNIGEDERSALPLCDQSNDGDGPYHVYSSTSSSQSLLCDGSAHYADDSGSIEAEFDEGEEDEELGLQSAMNMHRNTLTHEILSPLEASNKALDNSDASQFHHYASTAVYPNDHSQSNTPSSDTVTTSFLNNLRSAVTNFSPSNNHSIVHSPSTESTCLPFIQLDQCIYPQYPIDQWRCKPFVFTNSSNVFLTHMNSNVSSVNLPLCLTAADTFAHSPSTSLQGTPSQPHCLNLNSEIPVLPQPTCALPPISCTTGPLNHTYSGLPSNPSEWMEEPLIYSSYLHSKRARFPQASVTCIHHLRSTPSADTHKPNQIPTSGIAHLPTDVVAMTAAALPPLQPASRFRKARIHVTVEQWSFGRFSVLDCHVKAIPPWVLELQKKSTAGQETLLNGVNKKVKCLSCFVLKNQGPKEHNLQPITTENQFTDDFTGHTHFQHVHANLNLLEDVLEARAVIRNRHSESNKLFSFWNDGCRVKNNLLHMARLNVSNSVVSSEEVGANSIESIRQSDPSCAKNSEPSNEFMNLSDQFHFFDHSKSSQSVNIENEASKHIRSIFNAAYHEFEKESLLSDFPDPSSAYLRRHQESKDDAITQDVVPSDHNSCEKRPVTEPNVQNSIEDNLHSTVTSLTSVGTLSHGVVSSDAILESEEKMTVNCNEFLVNSNGFVEKLPSEVENGDFVVSGVRAVGGDSRRNPVDRKNPKHKTSLAYLTLHRSRSSSDGHHIRHYLRHSLSYSHADKPRKTDLFRNYCKIHRPFNLHHLNGSDPSSLKSLKLQDNSPHVMIENANPKTTILSDRLEARIRSSMEAIRSTLVNSFRDELANVLTENMNLRSELNRVTAELSLLRTYESAFFSLRPFVPPGIWEHICAQQLHFKRQERSIQTGSDQVDSHINCDEQ